jgi:hypothetical protein
LLKRFGPFVNMAAFAQSGIVDPYELDRLVEELAEREGERDVDASYPLPVLEPLSHEHPLLRAENPSFDVEEFLISRSHTSLPDLRAELKDYLALLKDELVQLINDDYEAFISLSTDLRAEGARLERLQTPMSGLRSEIEVCHHLLGRCADLCVRSNLELGFWMLKRLYKQSSMNEHVYNERRHDLIRRFRH